LHLNFQIVLMKKKAKTLVILADYERF